MKKALSFISVLLLSTAIMFVSLSAYADETSEVILKLLIKKGVITQEEVDALKAEIATEKPKVPEGLEARVDKLEKDVASKVGLEKLASKLKIKGRWAAGYYDTQKRGSFPHGSFEAPEAKIQFAFEPDDIHKIIMRMNLNNAAFNNLDYFYLDSKLSKFFNLPFELNARLGRFKLDLGEESWSNNPVESVLASNSAGNVAGNDEGFQLSGKLSKKFPLGWSASISNGVAGTGSDPTNAKAFTGKLFYNIIEPLYVSASYYHSGSMKFSNSEMSIAGISTRPPGALNWDRQIWEVDLRYDFGKGKTLNPPAYSDSKAFVRLAYGQFADEIEQGTAQERDGAFGFVEGTYNFTKKIYAAARYSIVDLDGEQTASLNGVTANKYQRYSFGLGYRLTDNTIFKLGYDINDEAGGGAEGISNNQFSAIVASQF
jgi:hypothetical protein